MKAQTSTLIVCARCETPRGGFISENLPKPGSFAVCATCGAINVFTESYTFRLSEPDEEKEYLASSETAAELSRILSEQWRATTN